MGVAKTSFNGNDYIGAFVTATDKFALVGLSIEPKKEDLIRETLGVETIKVSVDGSDLIGIYAAANSNGVLLPSMTSKSEADALKTKLPGLNIHLLVTDLNAMKNDILANDKFAIIDPHYSHLEAKTIGDVLGVEVMKLSIGGYETVGASNILTNRGIVLNSNASDEEISVVKDALGLPIEQTTANTGSSSVGLCTVANARGVIVGGATTGFELARITQALGF